MNDLAALLCDDATGAVPIHLTDQPGLAGAAGAIGNSAPAWVTASAYRAGPGSHLLVPGLDGTVASVLAGLPQRCDPFGALAIGKLARVLPPGRYRLAQPPERADLAAIGWLLGAYRFNAYRPNAPAAPSAQLVLPDGVDKAAVLRIARGCRLAFDLINTPANDMSPSVLAATAAGIAREFGATVHETIGDDLLTANLPMIHAVGRAGAEPPRLIDFTWGDPAHPKVTLVGKGVTFDTGGLDLKPSSAMLLMKKDMGGAANVLGLASMIMDAGLAVRLRVLIPIVENAVSAPSFRPGDILKSRKGITVEVGNTDAEGRLILGDALALADEEAPELLVDMATLTGAARVALGPDLPPFYTHDDQTAAKLAYFAESEGDPVWRLPLWAPYDDWICGQTADISNSPEKTFAGSITAALFLSRFVEHAAAHVHFDIYAWTPDQKPHAPKGGAAQAIRALFAMISARYRA